MSISSLQEWFEIIEHGTSGDQVTDALYSWKYDREILLKENSELKEEIASLKKELDDERAGRPLLAKATDQLREYEIVIFNLRARVAELEYLLTKNTFGTAAAESERVALGE